MPNSCKRLLLAGLVIVVMTVGCNRLGRTDVIATGTPGHPDSYPIWAGDMKDRFQVGRLDVWEDRGTVPTTLHVKYVVTEPDWFLTECRLAVAVALESIPQKNGNPTPDKFEWDSGPLVDLTEYEFLVPFGTGWHVNEVMYVAAHCALVQIVNGNSVQTQIGWSGTEPFPGRKWALYCLYVTEAPELPSGSGFRTVTQGDWGAPPEGDNWGKYLVDHFRAVFGRKLVVGYRQWLQLTSALAVQNYLPDCGVPTKLKKTCCDPEVSITVFAGQVVALTLNVEFDRWDPTFSPRYENLADLYVADPTSPFYGWTVQQVLDEANKVLGGGRGSYTPGNMNVCVTKINENCHNFGDNHFLSVDKP
jgi:hypothetical protein